MALPDQEPKLSELSEEEQMRSYMEFMRKAFKAGIPFLKLIGDVKRRDLIQRRPMRLPILGVELDRPIEVAWSVMIRDLVDRQTETDVRQIHPNAHYVITADGSVGWVERGNDNNFFHEMDGSLGFRSLKSNDLGLEPTASDLVSISLDRPQDTSGYLGYMDLLKGKGQDLNKLIAK